MGWERTAVGDVVEPLTTVDPRKRPNQSFTYIDVSSVSRTNFTIKEATVLQGKEAPSRARRLVRSGDVLFATIRPTLQRIAVVPDHLDGAVCSTGYFVLRPTSKVHSRYLFHYLFGAEFSQKMAALQRGASYPAVSDSDVRNHVMLLPPLPEQKRIVAILDEAFAGIDAAVANTEKNLANARELFESYLNSVFTQRGEGWDETNLETMLATQPRNGWSPPAAHHVDSGVPVLTLSSVTGFIFKSCQVKYTSAPTDPRRHYWVANGDLLITRSNTPELVGHVAIASGLREPTIYPDLIMRMVPNTERILTEFLYYQLRTTALRDEIMSRAGGANPTMKKIRKSSVQTLRIVVPGLAVQQQVIDSLRAIGGHVDRLIASCERRSLLLEELRQSLLQKALNGEYGISGPSCNNESNPLPPGLHRTNEP